MGNVPNGSSSKPCDSDLKEFDRYLNQEQERAKKKLQTLDGSGTEKNGKPPKKT